MYGENRSADATRFAKAWASNQLARFAPSLYVRLSRQTGRGDADTEDVEGIAGYFEDCFAEYFRMLGVDDPETWLRGKQVLEYGPGDLPGVALLMVAHGAERVVCVDRFPLVSVGPKNRAVLERLLAGLSGPARERAGRCFREPGKPASGFDPARIEYLIRPSGLSGLRNAVDLMISRAVLEHVDDLPATFGDMAQALKADGIAMHQVDLRSHGLHRRNPLDFLSWPVPAWNLMYSHKGVPNRWRVDRYREIVAAHGFRVSRLEPTHLAAAADIADVRPHLATPFRGLSDADLAWLGFWLVFTK